MAVLKLTFSVYALNCVEIDTVAEEGGWKPTEDRRSGEAVKESARFCNGAFAPLLFNYPLGLTLRLSKHEPRPITSFKAESPILL